MNSTAHPTPLHRLLRRARPPAGPLQPADPQRPDAAAGQRGHEPVQALLPGRGRARLPPGDQRAEVHPHLRHRDRRRPQPRHLLRDAGQLLLRRLLQGRRHRLRLGAGDRAVRAGARPPLGHRLPGRRRGDRAVAPVRCPPSASSAWARRTTSGRWGWPAPAAPARRSTTTAAPPSAAAAARPASPTAIWRSGTWCSCRTSGTRTINIIGELPEKNIDTGMGLERVAMVLQDADSMYETDLLAPVLHEVQELSGAAYGREDRVDRSLRIVAEHGRTASFLIADGVLPSNEGRGYILRRLLRRSVRHLRLLGVEDPALARVGQQVVANLGEAWPELVAQRSLIEQVVASEEESFSRTLRQGSTLLEGAIRRTREQGAAMLAGDTAFQLHDTYGFPYELTLEAAAEAGLDVDADRFRQLMDDQRRRAKEARRELDADLRRLDVLPGPVRPPRPHHLRRLRDHRRRGPHPGAAPRRRGAGRGRRGRPGRADPGPDAVLRRGRRPGRRHRPGPDRERGRAPGHRHPARPGGLLRSTAPGWCRARPGSTTRSTPRSTPTAGGRSPAATPPPTPSTGRSATCWASTPASRARWSTPAGCASTSPTSRPSRPSAWPRSRRPSTASSWPTRT